MVHLYGEVMKERKPPKTDSSSVAVVDTWSVRVTENDLVVGLWMPCFERCVWWKKHLVSGKIDAYTFLPEFASRSLRPSYGEHLSEKVGAESSTGTSKYEVELLQDSSPTIYGSGAASWELVVAKYAGTRPTPCASW